MAQLPRGTLLYNALLAEGFPLPDECVDVHLTMGIDDPFRLHYNVNVTGDQLARLGRALTRIGSEFPGAPAVANAFDPGFRGEPIVFDAVDVTKKKPGE